jgi:hypothetical protein
MAHRPLAFRAITVVLWLTIVLLLVLQLDTAPPFSYDEGCLAVVARNWAISGQYGELLDGRPVPPDMLNVGLPAVAPVALSFRIFGVGVWQARLPMVLIALAGIFVLAALARALFGRLAAAIAPFAATFLVLPIPFVSAGRQVWGETLSVLLVAMAYLLLVRLWSRPRLAVPLAAPLLALSIFTKVQALPFVAVALAGPLALALLRRERFAASIFAALAIASAAFYGLCAWLSAVWLGQPVLHHIYGATLGAEALVLYGPARRGALETFLTNGLPFVLALAWAWLRVLRTRAYSAQHPPESEARSAFNWPGLSFLVLTTAWALWYVTLSVGWARLLYPPALLASPFLAGMLAAIVQRVRDWRTAPRASGGATPRGSLLALVSIGTVVLVVGAAGWTVSRAAGVFGSGDRSIYEVASFVDDLDPASGTVETFEAELYFLLHRSYHHPPPPVALQLTRRRYVGDQTPMTYDPLADAPRLIVVGPEAEHTAIYSEGLHSGRYALLRRFGRYRVYQLD